MIEKIYHAKGISDEFISHEIFIDKINEIIEFISHEAALKNSESVGTSTNKPNGGKVCNHDYLYVPDGVKCQHCQHFIKVVPF